MNHNEYEQAKTDAAADEAAFNLQDACVQRMGDKWAELLPQVTALYDPSIPLKTKEDPEVFAIIAMAYGAFKIMHDMSKSIPAEDVKNFGRTSERKNRHAFLHEMVNQMDMTSRSVLHVKLMELCNAELSQA